VKDITVISQAIVTSYRAFKLKLYCKY